MHKPSRAIKGMPIENAEFVVQSSRVATWLVASALVANNLNMTIPGTRPLVTISARESSCIPKALCTFNFRAKKPSKKSKKIPKKTKKAVATKLL